MSGFQLSPSCFGNKGDASPLSHILCIGSTCTTINQQSQFHEKLEEENMDDSEATKEIRNLFNIFNSDCIMSDLPTDDLVNPMVQEILYYKIENV